MVPIGQDERAIHAGRIGILRETTRGLYCLNKPSLTRRECVEVRADYLTRDIYDDLGGRRG